MDEFGRFWNRHTMLIGVVTGLAALALALLKLGLPATALGLISGTAFMWVGRPIHTDLPDEEV